MKKIFVFIILIVISFLVGINIYISISNKSIKSQLSSLEITNSKIDMLDSFRTNIINLGHMQKSYLLTGDENFKTEYSKHLATAYTMLVDLLKNSAISNVEKENIEALLKDYENINTSFFNSPLSLPLNNHAKETLLNSNEVQFDILHTVTVAIASNTDASSSNSTTTVSKTVNTQNNFIKIISSFFTLLLSGPFYFIIKKFNAGELKLDSLFGLFKPTSTDMDNSNNLLPYIELIQKHNIHMKEEWQNTVEELEAIEKTLDSFKYSEIEGNPPILTLKCKLFQLKLMIKQLPNYHEYISQLTENLINNSRK